MSKSCAEQFGFVKNKCTADACFILDTIVDAAIAKGECLYVAFIDFEKAYDFVPRDALFFKMLHAYMNGPVLHVLYSMYQSVYSVVQLGVNQSDVIYQMIGLRQGCILSPCLFSFYIADFPAFLGSRVHENRYEGVKLIDTVVRVLMYADDMALVSSSAADLQRMLNALYEYCSLWRMLVNVRKTKVMVFHQCPSNGSGTSRQRMLDIHNYIHNECNFVYNGMPLEVVSEFKYLGIMFSEFVGHMR